MKNKREQEAIRAYFAQEPVPVEIHNALRQACQQLPPREESPAPAAGKAWRRLGGALSTAAAAFVLLCCLNAVNPAFAESVPLLGEAFRLYNSQNKVAVGSYVGTYPQMEQPDAAAAAADAQGMELTLHESYSDGVYIHLSFALENVPESLWEDLYFLSGKVEAQVDGQKLEPTYVALYPQGGYLTGSLALALPQAAADGAELELSYQVTELERYFAMGGSSEAVEGAFSGRAAITVDTSHNRTVEDFESNGTVEINWVEATPSYTKINYTIPYWGKEDCLVVNYPRLYLLDGTPVQYSLEGSDFPREATGGTLTATAFFDGLPNGTEQVVLRFYTEQVTNWEPSTKAAPLWYPVSGEAREILVLAEATVDLATGTASPSQTYLDYGLSYAADYGTRYSTLNWMLPFDDRAVAGQAYMSQLAELPGLFQQGLGLWELTYTKDGGCQAEFVLLGDAPTEALEVTVAREDGGLLAQGTLAPADIQAGSDGGGSFYYWGAALECLPGQEPQLLDTVTVTVTQGDSQEPVFQREVSLGNRDKN